MIRQILKSDNQRSEKIKKNIIYTLVVKGCSILINLALLPLTISYLSPLNYGVWVTISSMLAWINFFDIGLGHGLRNKLAEALSRDETAKAKTLVSTAYIAIGVLCLVLVVIFFAGNLFINWNTLLNIPPTVNEDFNTIAFILFAIAAAQFVLQLINSIFLGTQQSARVSFFNMLSNVFVLAGIFILVNTSKESLFKVAILFSVVPLLTLLSVNIYFFKTSFKNFSPAFSFYSKDALKEVLHLGVKFFIIQITVLVFFQTSNLLICRFFTPELVPSYTLAFRYFGIISMIFNMITSPYWSAYTEAYVKQDIEWIKKSLRRLFWFWVLLAIAAVVMLLFAEYAYKILSYNKIQVTLEVSVGMLIYTVLTAFGNVYIMLLNGVGRIKWQMIMNVMGMLIFIPLSYYLGKILNWGVVGIITSTIVCSSYGVLVAPFEVRKLLKEMESRKEGSK